MSIVEKAEKMATKFVRDNFSFVKDSRAEANVIKLIMGVFIIAILVSALIPTSINSIVSGRCATWSANVLATYDSITILIVVVIVAILAGLAYRAFND